MHQNTRAGQLHSFWERNACQIQDRTIAKLWLTPLSYITSGSKQTQETASQNAVDLGSAKLHLRLGRTSTMSYHSLEANNDDYEDEIKSRPSFESHRRIAECQSCKDRRGGRKYSLLILVASSNVLLLVILFILSMILKVAPFRASRSTKGVNQEFYGADLRYMSLDHKFDYLWASEAEGNNGVVYLPPYNGQTSHLGNIGMFHQLHCLTSFRAALQRAREGEDIGIDPLDNSHWPHCLFYMRQAILCSADDTIELPRYSNGSLGGKVLSGEWDARTCGNADELYAFRRKHGLGQGS